MSSRKDVEKRDICMVYHKSVAQSCVLQCLHDIISRAFGGRSLTHTPPKDVLCSDAIESDCLFFLFHCPPTVDPCFTNKSANAISPPKSYFKYGVRHSQVPPLSSVQATGGGAVRVERDTHPLINTRTLMKGQQASNVQRVDRFANDLRSLPDDLRR